MVSMHADRQPKCTTGIKRFHNNFEVIKLSKPATQLSISLVQNADFSCFNMRVLVTNCANKTLFSASSSNNFKCTTQPLSAGASTV